MAALSSFSYCSGSGGDSPYHHNHKLACRLQYVASLSLWWEHFLSAGVLSSRLLQSLTGLLYFQVCMRSPRITIPQGIWQMGRVMSMGDL